MKGNFGILCGIGLVTAMVSLSCRTPAAPVAEEEAVSEAPAAPGEQGQAEVYVDPTERFTAPLPANWTVTEHEQFVTLTDPSGGLRVHLSAVEGADIEGAIVTAWGWLPTMDAPAIERVMSPPPPAGLEAVTFIHYRVDDDHLAQAFGQLLEGVVYVALIEGDIAAVQRRAAQVQIIASGFRPTGLDRADLSKAQARALTPQDIASLRAHIEQAMEAYAIPGASVGIVENDEVVFEQSFGVQEVGREIPVTPETLMMIGSTTKTMTTLLMANLVDEGLMSWDTPAREILPEFAVRDPELSETITMRNLVCACTGVPRRDLEIIFNYRSLNAERVMESLATFEFFTDFGEAFQYSNQMVAAGGYVAAAALGSPYGQLFEGYERAMNERIFGPLGMNHTTVSFDEAMANVNAATPHGRRLDAAYEPINVGIERFAEPLAPAGAVWSNTRDMTLYLRMLLARGVTADGTRLVSTENLAETWQPQVSISADDSYGLGWIVSDYYGQPLLSHGGATLGFSSELAFLPNANLGITILVNAGGAGAFANSIRTHLFELVYDQPPRAEEQLRFGASQVTEQLEFMRNRLAQELDAERVAPYLGRYQNEALGVVVLEMDEDRLFVDAGEFRSELRPMGEPEPFVVMTVDPPLLGFELTLSMNEAGAPSLRIGAGAMAYTFERIE